MRVSVVREVGAVVVDGGMMHVDCSELPSYIHAIQWDGKQGWIEFKPDADGQHVPNMKIVDLKPYSFLVDRWRLAMKEKSLEERQAQVSAAEQAVRAKQEEAEHKEMFAAAAAASAEW